MVGLVCSENLYLLFFQQTIKIIKNLFFERNLPCVLCLYVYKTETYTIVKNMELSKNSLTTLANMTIE